MTSLHNLQRDLALKYYREAEAKGLPHKACLQNAVKMSGATMDQIERWRRGLS